MARSGLLILTSPAAWIIGCIPGVLSEAVKHVEDILYVHFAPGIESSSVVDWIPCTKTVDDVVTRLYSHAASHHSNLDLRVIIGNIGRPVTRPRPAIQTFSRLQHPHEILLTDSSLNDSFRHTLTSYAEKHFTQATEKVDVKALSFKDGINADSKVDDTGNTTELEMYDNICMGGTFDRLHTGHKILLSHAAMLTKDRLIVGVTDGAMNEKKLICELMEATDLRIQVVQSFLEDVKPQIVYEVVPIQNPYGPSITDSNIQCIVVSEETLKGGNAVNLKRQEQNMTELAVDVIELVKDTHQQPGEEAKISSSSLRRRLLGTLLKPTTNHPDNSPPYIIGLTGGIASGKSSVCRRLEGLGAAVIDCDKLGHQAYAKDGAAYAKVIEAFGTDIVAEDETINRAALGPKVFGNAEARKRLNDITWPVIRDMAKQQIAMYKEKGSSVVVLDAAILLEAGWDDMAHEVWTTIIPKQEAVTRIVERNKLTEEAAERRISSQMSNQARVDRANVVLCTLWEYETTQKQVETAWKLLQERLPHSSRPHSSI